MTSTLEHLTVKDSRVIRSRQIKNRHIRLRPMDRRQQLIKDLTDSWGVLWAMRGMKCQNRDAGGQLLKGQQGIPLEFLGNGRGGELGHEVSCDCFQCSHKGKKGLKSA